MSLQSKAFKALATLSDKQRDKDLKVDETIHAHYGIQYVGKSKFNRLDVCYPKGTIEPLPVIVNFHGGGFVYGMKESYLHYGMYLARQGFVFINPNYHLAPNKQFPTQLNELNQVMEWLTLNAQTYHIDLNHVFLVGDSAGAQMASQYAAIYSNDDYAKLFDFDVPEDITIRALALNCGMYDLSKKMKAPIREEFKETDANLLVLLKDYLGKNWEKWEEHLAIKDNITSAFPPTFVMTAEYDFLREDALPMYEALLDHKVEATYKVYGEKGDTNMTHIFHCNMNLEEARVCNREQSEWFKTFIKREGDSD